MLYYFTEKNVFFKEMFSVLLLNNKYTMQQPLLVHIINKIMTEIYIKVLKRFKR